jgi:hypothetical protein
MLWTEDIQELLKPELIPVHNMSIEEKLNSITRLIIFIGLIVSLISRDMRLFLLTIILVLIIPIIYNFHKKYQKDADTFLNQQSIDVIDNKLCVRPTIDNPFMNPSPMDINTEKNSHGSCPIYDKKIGKKVDELFSSNIFRNADDIYDRESSKRQFYTVPMNKIPNNQNQFANWLYGRPKTCKENNGEQCYANMFHDLRL